MVSYFYAIYFDIQICAGLGTLGSLEFKNFRNAVPSKNPGGGGGAVVICPPPDRDIHPNNSNETHTFMCLGRTGHFGQHYNCSKVQI